MGLCKCPKKRVTNLFCFVHRVNVCEDCMIANHSRCVVQSYLQWLQDSDYEPVCILCNHSLDEGDVVRLCCHDLFHLSCLDKYVQSHSSGSNLTALKCPCCKDTFFPSPNMTSLVADKFRQAIKSYWWGREGMGLAPEEYEFEDDEILTTTLKDELLPDMNLDSQLTSTPMTSHSHTREEKPHDDHVTLQLYDKPLNRSVHVGYSNTYEAPERYAQIQHGYIPVTDQEDKYKRKNPIEFVRRWYRNHRLWSSPLDDDTSSHMKRYLFIACFIFISVVTIIIILTRVGHRSSANSNLDTDWKFNPQIKTGQ